MSKQVNGQALIVLPVFDLDECDEITAEVLKCSPFLVDRGNFWTLGAATYQDDPKQYPAIANAFNPIIEQHFGWCLNKVKAVLEEAFDTTVGRFAQGVGYPSFHVFDHTAGSTKGHVHIDEPYERVDFSEIEWDAPFSFTVAVSLPKAGGGCEFWWDYSCEDLEKKDAAGTLPPPVYMPYQLGYMYIHSGMHPHRIANPEPHMVEGEWRVTLQGHGITTDNGIVVYF